MRRYVLQRVNQHVFADPAALMHQRRAGDADTCAASSPRRVSRRSSAAASRSSRPAPVPATSATLAATAGVRYHYIEGSVTHEAIRSEEQARSAASAFGAFQRGARRSAGAATDGDRSLSST